MTGYQMVVIITNILYIWIYGVQTLNTDLVLNSFVVYFPDPLTNVFISDTDIDITSISLSVRNNGPDQLNDSTPNLNYDIKMYIADLEEGEMLDKIEVSDFDLGTNGIKRTQSLDEGSIHIMGTPTAVVNYPSDKCSTHSHLCIALILQNNVYEDTTSANDFACLPFIEAAFSIGAGATNCPSLPVVQRIVITDPILPVFEPGQSLPIVMDIEIHNYGGQEVPGGPDNIGFYVFLSNRNEPQFENFIDFSDSVDYNRADLSENILPWQQTVYSNISVSITIPIEDCQVYQYVCIDYKPGNNGVLFENENSESAACLRFNDVTNTGAGRIICPMSTTTTTATEMSSSRPPNDILWIIIGAVAGAVLLVVSVCVLVWRLYCKKHSRVRRSP
ncbi:uncharacterized protein [Ptychodera flava]